MNDGSGAWVVVEAATEVNGLITSIELIVFSSIVVNGKAVVVVVVVDAYALVVMDCATDGTLVFSVIIIGGADVVVDVTQVAGTKVG